MGGDEPIGGVKEGDAVLLAVGKAQDAPGCIDDAFAIYAGVVARGRGQLLFASQLWCLRATSGERTGRRSSEK